MGGEEGLDSPQGVIALRDVPPTSKGTFQMCDNHDVAHWDTDQDTLSKAKSSRLGFRIGPTFLQVWDRIMGSPSRIVLYNGTLEYRCIIPFCNQNLEPQSRSAF